MWTTGFRWRQQHKTELDSDVVKDLRFEDLRFEDKDKDKNMKSEDKDL